MPGTAARYFVNTVNLARQQEGWRAGAATAVGLSAHEARKVPRLLRLRWNARKQQPRGFVEAPVVDVPELLRQLADFEIEVQPVTLDREAFARHLQEFAYPRFYAGGPVADGGFREAKILEYFLSLQLLPIAPTDVVIDVASERSVFPNMVGETIGARVLRQDLRYPPGVRGDRIGGSAAAMPVPASFADKLFLHNSFEHFEGDADTTFVAEASRVLKPFGAVCIVPLYLSTRYQILTDPLEDKSGIEWDPGSEIVERIGHHNRFGRCYSVQALVERVLEPAAEHGFHPTIHHFTDVDPTSPDPLRRAQRGIRFTMVLRKLPSATPAPG
jgi:hypothetical protein